MELETPFGEANFSHKGKLSIILLLLNMGISGSLKISIIFFIVFVTKNNLNLNVRYIKAVKGNDEFAVQGAVRVLKELSRDLTDSQIPAVAPAILPDIYRIFCESDRYTVRTRSRAVEIFTTLTTMICTIGI